MDWKQYIIVNKGLGMSSGKMAAQVAHASLAPFTNMIKECVEPFDEDDSLLLCSFVLSKALFDNWINGIFTKVILEAKNEVHMEKIEKKLIDAGFVKNQDYFNIVDCGTTEFNGVPHWTCIGLIPMDSTREDIKSVVKKLQLFKE